MMRSRIPTSLATRVAAAALVLLMLSVSTAWAAGRRPDRVQRHDRFRNPTVVVHWNEATLEEIRNAVPKTRGRRTTTGRWGPRWARSSAGRDASARG
jgi:hypothetical protein